MDILFFIIGFAYMFIFGMRLLKVLFFDIGYTKKLNSLGMVKDSVSLYRYISSSIAISIIIFIIIIFFMIWNFLNYYIVNFLFGAFLCGLTTIFLKSWSNKKELYHQIYAEYLKTDCNEEITNKNIKSNKEEYKECFPNLSENEVNKNKKIGTSVIKKENLFKISKYIDIISLIPLSEYIKLRKDEEQKKNIYADASNIEGFSFEYLVASLFLAFNHFSTLDVDKKTFYEIMDGLLFQICKTVLSENYTKESFEDFKKYFTMRLEEYNIIFDRTGESLMNIAKKIVNNCCGADAIGNLNKNMIVCNMLIESINKYINVINNTKIINENCEYEFLYSYE